MRKPKSRFRRLAIENLPDRTLAASLLVAFDAVLDGNPLLTGAESLNDGLGVPTAEVGDVLEITVMVKALDDDGEEAEGLFSTQLGVHVIDGLTLVDAEIDPSYDLFPVLGDSSFVAGIQTFDIGGVYADFENDPVPGWVPLGTLSFEVTAPPVTNITNPDGVIGISVGDTHAADPLGHSVFDAGEVDAVISVMPDDGEAFSSFEVFTVADPIDAFHNTNLPGDVDGDGEVHLNGDLKDAIEVAMRHGFNVSVDELPDDAGFVDTDNNGEFEVDDLLVIVEAIARERAA